MVLVCCVNDTRRTCPVKAIRILRGGASIVVLVCDHMCGQRTSMLISMLANSFLWLKKISSEFVCVQSFFLLANVHRSLDDLGRRSIDRGTGLENKSLLSPK